MLKTGANSPLPSGFPKVSALRWETYRSAFDTAGKDSGEMLSPDRKPPQH